MAKYLQKTASTAQARRQEGVLYPQAFARQIKARLYKPAAELRPFVAHYFIGRRRLPQPTTVTEVVSQPIVLLLFTAKGAMVAGPSTRLRTISLPKGSGTIVAVRFKPAGFYAFWRRTMAQLAEKSVPATTVFPAADKAYCHELLKQTDAEITKSLNSLLKQSQPQPQASAKIILAQRIVKAVEASQAATVSQVAAQFKLSERAVQQLFSTYVGVRLKWSLMRVRLLEALRSAHQNPAPNWTQIAADLGYNTQSHFINDFKKVVGQTPREYARRQKGRG